MHTLIDKYMKSENAVMDLEDFQYLLECGETNLVERKSLFLLLKKKSFFEEELSQVVSAFSNYGEGVLLLGVNNKGEPEWGVLKDENIDLLFDSLNRQVAMSVSPMIRSFTVKKVNKEGDTLFVVFIDESKDAPHQANNGKMAFRYYSRINQECLPIDGNLVRDIFSRRSQAHVLPKNVEVAFLDTPKFYQISFALHNSSTIPAEDLLMFIEIDGPTRNEFASAFHGPSRTEYPDSFTYPSARSIRTEYRLIYPNMDVPIRFKPQLINNEPCKLCITLVAKNMSITKYRYQFSDGQLTALD